MYHLYLIPPPPILSSSSLWLFRKQFKVITYYSGSREYLTSTYLIYSYLTR